MNVCNVLVSDVFMEDKLDIYLRFMKKVIVHSNFISLSLTFLKRLLVLMHPFIWK